MALRYFDKQHQRRLKGNRDLCAPRKSIESDYPEREQVESQGGPRHVCNLSLFSLSLSSGAMAVSPVSAASGWLESSVAPDRAQPTSRQALQRRSATTSLSPGSSPLRQPPRSYDGPLQSTIRNHLVEKRLQGQWYIVALWCLRAQNNYI